MEIERSGASAILIENTDAEKHNIVWLERLSVQRSSNRVTELPTGSVARAIELRLKSAYVLIRNVDAENNMAGLVEVTFTSETREKESEVTLAQNTFWRTRRRDVIGVVNRGIRDANVRMSRNDLRHNSGSLQHDCVRVENATLEMQNNLFHDNTGRYILFASDDHHEELPKDISDNLFWLNAGLSPATKTTVSIRSENLTFTGNALQNPANEYEFVAEPRLVS